MLLFALITGAMNKWEFTSSGSKRETQYKDTIERERVEHAAEIGRVERIYEARLGEREKHYDARLREKDTQIRRLLEINEKQAVLIGENTTTSKNVLDINRQQWEILRQVQDALNNPPKPNRRSDSAGRPG
jgi:hypothetical protein